MVTEWELAWKIN